MTAVRARLGATLLVLVVALGLGGCAAPAEPDDGARPVTTEESQLLAISRFQNFDRGSRPFEATLTEQGAEVHLQGWVDYASQVGYAAVTGEGFDPQSLLWTDTTVGLIASELDADGMPPLPVPAADDPGWSSRPIDATTSALDATLALIGNLGADRPENPLLLQQAGALWLREDEVNGVPVTVFAAPPSDTARTDADPPVEADTSPLRLWVDDEGVMLRVETRRGDVWYTIDLGADAGPALAAPTTGGGP